MARPRLAPLLSPRMIAWFRTLFATAQLVVITTPISACRDPTDDKFLELAVDGRADMILSGNSDLLVLDRFRGIPILAPAKFVQTTNQ
jgi:putative PIN family toxin of toxin-antitoxin system